MYYFTNESECYQYHPIVFTVAIEVGNVLSPSILPTPLVVLHAMIWLATRLQENILLYSISLSKLP